VKRALLACVVLAACATDHRDPADVGKRYDQCDGDPASFVRQSFLSLVGRRPRSQAEVDVYVDLYAAASDAGADPKDAVARAIMTSPEFEGRWIDTLMDALQVQRLDRQNEESCWGTAKRSPDSGGLATSVRDHAARDGGDGMGEWSMLDLARSSLALDDVTPLYRAQLFSMLSHPIDAANVDDTEAELARRADFGTTFDAAYLHRDIVCLGCHTSSHSVTDSDDPLRDRHWPVAGNPEAAVFGVIDTGTPDRAHGALRVAGFRLALRDGGIRPWGWTTGCGGFAPTPSSDVAPVDTYLGSVRGTDATAYDLEQALARGFASLRGGNVPVGGAATISDPDTALAWLVTLKITEDVFERATGTSLTIANYFPRNADSSDVLYNLAVRLATSGYSLRALLAAIVSTELYNRAPAEAGCGTTPYNYPAVFDPWVISDSSAERRKNSPGDAITAVDARTLMSAVQGALEWADPPAASRFPTYGGVDCELSCAELDRSCSFFNDSCCAAYDAACVMMGAEPAIEAPFQRAIGAFLRNSEAGFRSLDFQARLAWEDRYGTCTKPRWVNADFIDAVIGAAASGDATVRDVVAAIKDRLIGEPTIAAGAETEALVALIGADLDAPATAVTAEAARGLGGALLGTPRFLLQGMAGGGGDLPALTPEPARYAAVCAALAARVPAVRCGEATLSLVP